jgi:hypothetical protein
MTYWYKTSTKLLVHPVIGRGPSLSPSFESGFTGLKDFHDGDGSPLTPFDFPRDVPMERLYRLFDKRCTITFRGLFKRFDLTPPLPRAGL